jgi:hypothetical protein
MIDSIHISFHLLIIFITHKQPHHRYLPASFLAPSS